ncbi:hypothetical protein NDU88_006210 [Pleurodeles waltl]|uniref:Uncharacterized protein n=1 Tax=Pleurodeles waltl TaxID=8319 RepID=A0AAV7SNX7_PLEWA|nr:hypothetical protein NDU88_006210 [Pleurodeles waltl]
MEVDAKVLEAMGLLRQAGRMDLLKEEALAPGRPARRASVGVTAAVAACSPPRASGTMQVRGGSRGAVAKGVSGAGKGRAGRQERGPASLRVSPEAGPSGIRLSWEPARTGKAGPQSVARPQGGRLRKARALKASAAGKGEGLRKAGVLHVRAAGKGEGQKAMGARGGPGAFSGKKGLTLSDRA